jgi:hypothetical protein
MFLRSLNGSFGSARSEAQAPFSLGMRVSICLGSMVLVGLALVGKSEAPAYLKNLVGQIYSIPEANITEAITVDLGSSIYNDEKAARADQVLLASGVFLSSGMPGFFLCRGQERVGLPANAKSTMYVVTSRENRYISSICVYEGKEGAGGELVNRVTFNN